MTSPLSNSRHTLLKVVGREGRSRESPGNDRELLNSACGTASGDLDGGCKKRSGFPGFSSHSKGTEAISLTGDEKLFSSFGRKTGELAGTGCELWRSGLPGFSSHSTGAEAIWWTGDWKLLLSACERGGGSKEQ